MLTDRNFNARGFGDFDSKEESERTRRLGDRISERGMIMKMPDNKGKRCSKTIDKDIDRYRQEKKEEGMKRYVTVEGQVVEGKEGEESPQSQNETSVMV